MAEKVIIPLEAKVDKAIEEISALNEKLEDVAKSNKAAAKSTKSLAKGFKGLGLAMKAAGIGLVIEAFNFLKNIIGQNQAVIDTLSTATTSLGIIFREVGDLVVGFGESIFNAFQQPQKTLAKLGEKFEEFRTYITDKFSGVGTLLTGVFTFDSDMIKEGLSEIKGDLQDFSEDVTDVYNNVTTTVATATKNFVDTTKKAIETGSDLTQLKNEVALLEAGQQKLMLTYQNQAELQRQIRDDESATFEQRIAANEELGRILDEQLQTEQDLAQKKLDLAQKELAQNSDNLELQKAVIAAETELVDIEERITGQRSEQLTNANTLLREQLDATNELGTIGKTQREQELTELDQWYKEKLKLAKKAGVDTENIDKEFAKRKKKITQSQVNDELAAIGSLAGALNSLAGENKELAAAQAIIQTYLGASKAFGQGGVLGFVTAAAVIAGGLANVKKIYDTKLPSGSGGGGASASVSSGGSIPTLGPSIAATIPTQTNLTDVVSSVNNRNQEPIRAYVIGQDVTDSQEAQSYLNNQKTL